MPSFKHGLGISDGQVSTGASFVSGIIVDKWDTVDWTLLPLDGIWQYCPVKPLEQTQIAKFAPNCKQDPPLFKKITF